MDDATAAAVFNVNNRATKVDVPTSSIVKYAILAGVWAPVKVAYAANNEAAIVAVDALDAFDSFTYSDPTTLAFLDAALGDLVTAVTEFTDTHKATILAMGDSTQTLGQEIGLPIDPVMSHDIAEARV